MRQHKAELPTKRPAEPKPSKRYASKRPTAARCSLWTDATQTVFGEGPQHARIMLVGEQPGDKEDLAGRPFVGPAGQMLDRAMDEAGIDRSKVYVTDAVKHFKFVQRGKIRLHEKPNTDEIEACRRWYERELAAIKPEPAMALGAISRQACSARSRRSTRTADADRATDGMKALVTVDPSYLWRLYEPSESARV